MAEKLRNFWKAAARCVANGARILARLPGWFADQIHHWTELNLLQRILLCLSLAAISAGVIGLGSYGISLLSSAGTKQELREVYETAEESQAPAETDEAADSASDAPVEETARDTMEEDAQETKKVTSPEKAEAVAEEPAGETAQADPEAASAGETAQDGSGAETQAGLLPDVPYPANPGGKISDRFQALREKNRDIIGWLKMGGAADEAVVQRDNVFYLDHDALGNANVNGALFMDAGVALATRPYVYIIYGHNMRVGAEFGSLRNYENRSFYRKDPFISFETMYESGNYVIFAVSTVNVEKPGEHYVDFLSLLFNHEDEHQAAIEALQAASIYPEAVDVRADDQLLLLVTCVARDDERRVVAARRIREGEQKEDLAETIAGSLR